MRIHIQGICGTLMAGVAVLAKQLGYQVSGTDKAMYPPMSHQLQDHAFEISLDNQPMLQGVAHAIVGNAMSRGQTEVEALLNAGIPYSSGAGWLAEQVLAKRKVLAVAGTHGKTSTSSMLLWIMQSAGLKPGYLIGGVPKFLKASADIGIDDWFVIEADEYDSAFFDKRAKCLNYKPFAAIINNLEFDHADIYKNLLAIQAVFKQWVRCLPSHGALICPAQSPNIHAIAQTANQWTQVECLHQQEGWLIKLSKDFPQTAEWFYQGVSQGQFQADWLCAPMAENALAAIVMAQHVVKLPAAVIAKALSNYPGVARRLECKGLRGKQVLYDDFAHHPSAIKQVCSALRARHPDQPLLVCLELGAYTLQQQAQLPALVDALQQADQILMIRSEKATIDYEALNVQLSGRLRVFSQPAALLDKVKLLLAPNSVVITLSSREFVGVRQPLFDWWQLTAESANCDVSLI